MFAVCQAIIQTLQEVKESPVFFYCYNPKLYNRACTVGCVENGNQRVFRNLLAFFAAIWYIE